MRCVQTLMLGSLATNCFIVYTDDGHVVAADPGGEPEKVLSFLKERNLSLTKVLLTHGHWDHIAAVSELQKATGAEVYIHESDAEMLTDPHASLADWIEPCGDWHTVTDYHTVKDGDVIEDGSVKFTVMHTPGHTKGSVCYLCEDILLAGDTLFYLSRGRTDFPGGSNAEMLESFRKLKALPGDYRVFPGHNELTTLDFERNHNPIMRGII